MAQPSVPAPPGRPTAFIFGAFVLSAIIGVAVLYFGLTGGLGGPIPGAHAGSGPAPPPDYAACQGHDGRGTFNFSFVAGTGGVVAFNGTHPGPCVAVVVGSSVTVNFSVAADAGSNHSWVLVNASNASTALSPPAFAGAGLTGGERFAGIPPGTSKVFHFNASSVGAYKYICEVSGHYDQGMWGWFYVTSASGPPSAASPAASASAGFVPAPLARPN